MTGNRRNQLRGWILFDLGNSAYHLLIPVVLMPILFRELLFEFAANPDLLWSVTVSLSVVLGAVASPIIGTIADRRCRRVKYLAIATGSTVICGVVMLVVYDSSPWVTAGSFVCSYASFVVALSLYDSLIVYVSSSENRSMVSGLGWGIGYLGGILVLAFVFPILAGATLPDGRNLYRAAMAVGYAFFLIVGLWSVWMFRDCERYPVRRRAHSSTAVHAWSAHGHDRHAVFRVLGSYYFANDGLATMVYFTSIYAVTTLGFRNTEVLLLFLIVQIVAVPATICSGWFAQRVGQALLIRGVLLGWILLTIGFTFAHGLAWFLVIAVGTGLLIGSTPALYRAMLGDYVRGDRASSVFGYGSLVGRASSVAGPLMFGVIASVFDSQRVAMLSLLVFYGMAFVLLPRDARSDEEAVPREATDE